MNNDIQKSIVDSIKIIGKTELDKIGYTITRTGRVEKVEQEEYTVNIMESSFTCHALLHLQGMLKVGDVVMIQFPSNDSSNKTIINKV